MRYAAYANGNEKKKRKNRSSYISIWNRSIISCLPDIVNRALLWMYNFLRVLYFFYKIPFINRTNEIIRWIINLIWFKDLYKLNCSHYISRTMWKQCETMSCNFEHLLISEIGGSIFSGKNRFYTDWKISLLFERAPWFLPVISCVEVIKPWL